MEGSPRGVHKTWFDLSHLCTSRSCKYKSCLATVETVLITLGIVPWLETKLRGNDQERCYLYGFFIAISQARCDLRDKSKLFPYLVLLGLSNRLVC